MSVALILSPFFCSGKLAICPGANIPSSGAAKAKVKLERHIATIIASEIRRLLFSFLCEGSFYQNHLRRRLCTYNRIFTKKTRQKNDSLFLGSFFRSISRSSQGRSGPAGGNGRGGSTFRLACIQK